MKTLKPWVGVFLGCLFFGANLAWADHIDEALFREVYQGLKGPECEFKNRTENAGLDCGAVDEAEYGCWRQKLHMYYDETTIRTFIEEIHASNEKYAYYGEPYYNEFFSNLNWDTILAVTGNC